MQIEIDISIIPPTIVLHEPDDFNSFKVLVRGADHARVPVGVLEQLAGDRASDLAWQYEFKRMLAYAEQQGWVDDNGVRAHVERG